MILFYNTFFFTLLLFCAFIAFAQWRLSNDRAILWYLGYIGSNFVHYLWQFGKDWAELGTKSGFLIELDTPASYLATACYLLFIWTVFDVEKVSPRLSKVFIGFAWFYAIMMVFNLLLQLCTTYTVWMPIHRVVRLLGFPFLLWLTYFMFRSSRLFYHKLILLGTWALLLGYVSALVVKGNHAPGLHDVPGDFIHFIQTPLGEICLYDVKFGVALDVICFSWAITLRQKRLWQALVPPTPPIHILPLVPPAEDAFLMKVHDTLSQNYQNENLTVEQVSQAVFLSTSQTTRKLKDKTGLTTEQYILRFRLDRALGLLLGSELPIGQIVHQVGLKDLPHFSQAFKKQYGLSPSQARKKEHKNADNTQNSAE